MGRLFGFIATLIAIAMALAVALVAIAPRPSVPPTSVPGPGVFSPPKPPVELQSAQAKKSAPIVAAMTLEQRIRSLFIVTKSGTESLPLTDFLRATQAGGFILMGKNIPATPSELASLTVELRGDSDFPRLIAIDEEGGEVKRLPYDTFPGADTLRGSPPPSTTSAFTDRGRLLASVGATFNFGIVADVASDPTSFIYGRSFGGDPRSTAERVSAAVLGESASPVISTLKHFPGHGSAPGDSHLSIPQSSLSYADWRSTDAIPFISGLNAQADAVMFGHLLFPQVDAAPASLSVRWHDILRRDLGFRGLAVTDDMTMLQRSKLPDFADPVENAIRAVAAGNDVLVYVFGDDPASVGVNIDEVVAGIAAAVRSGRISSQQVNESALRVMAARRGLANVDDPQVCNISCVFAYSRLGHYSAVQ